MTISPPSHRDCDRLATNASPTGIAVLRDAPSRDQNIIKAGAAGYAKTDHDLYRTVEWNVFTTTDCDTLHFIQTGRRCGRMSQSIPAFRDIPMVSNTSFY
jgi:hypothetical protein